jgi:hypothetical protein
MKKVSILISVFALGLLSSCTDAYKEKMFNYGNEFTVEMYSGDYYFSDKATGKLVEVAGDIVITNVN